MASLLGVTAALASLASPSALGQDAEQNRTNRFGLRFGGGWSDNVFRQITDEQSGSYSSLGLNMDMLRETRRVDARLFGNVEFRGYSQSEAENERVGSLDASVELHAVPEVFSWFFGDTAGTGRTNPLRPAGPGNREEINVFSTGPRFNVALGDRTALQLNGTVGQRTFQDSNRLDSDTTTVELDLLRSVSRTTQLGVGASLRQVEYDFSQLDNDIESVFITYERALATGRASVRVGSSKLDYISTDDTTALVEIAWGRDFGARSQLNISVENGYNDVADEFRFANDIRDLPLDPLDNGLVLTADVYESSRANISYQINGDRTRVSLSGAVFDNQYTTDSNLNNDGYRTRLGLERQVSPQMTIGGNLDYIQRDYVRLTQSDEDTRFELWLRRQFARRFSIEVNLQHNARSGRLNGDFDENAARVFFEYDLSNTARPN